MQEQLNHHYTKKEERLNVITHGFGLLLSIVALPILVIKSFDYIGFWSQFSFILYGVSLIVLYSASTFYHAAKEVKMRRKLNILDHAAIYILIAGSYSPFCVVGLSSNLGWYMFIFVWVFALVGVILKLFFTGKYDKLSTIMYLVMGWQIIIFIRPLVDNISSIVLFFLILGGAFYSIGKIKYNHAIFHVFVILGSFSHFLGIILLQ